MSNLFNVLGSSLQAQTVRLSTVASNIANADQVASRPEDAYRARVPVFATVLEGAQAGAVQVVGVAESAAPARAEHNPGHPLADAAGNIYRPNLSAVEAMADMLSASRTYEASAQALSTAQELTLRTLRLGQ